MFDSKRKKDPWKPRDAHAIVRVWPRFYSIPGEDSKDFEPFRLTKLLLYKPFCDIYAEIGLSTEIIVEKWRNFRYRAWHVDWNPSIDENIEDGEDDDFANQEMNLEDDFQE